MLIRRIYWAAMPVAIVGVGIAIMAGRRGSDRAINIHFGHLAEQERVTEQAYLIAEGYRPRPKEGAFLELTRLGDDAVASAGFTVAAPTQVQVFAVGEGSGGEMHDYGRIIDAATRRTVWRMEYHETAHAGGAQKNRVADRVLTLDSGSYLVYYSTDGSHSWDDWNTSAPADPDAWGVTLFADSAGRAAIQPYDASADPSVMVRLTGIGDDEHRSHQFTLAEAADLRVYALGEGSGGTMYDCAWLEDGRSGATVWEMAYESTQHAGGARKNRVFDGVISLAPGTYVLHYQTDGSHSAGDWNASPPDDPFGWGVTLFRQASSGPN